MDNTVQETRVQVSPCLKYFSNVFSNFPSLRAAIRSIGLEPTFIHVNKGGYGFSKETIIVKIELSHNHIPEFYRRLMDKDEDLKRIYAVARTQVSYKPNKHLVFVLDDDRRHGCYWLDPKREALHLDVTTNEWSVGRGKLPVGTIDI